jgi:hypothetical protein
MPASPAFMLDRSSELRHVSHDVPGCDYDAYVAALHVPTGKRFDRTMRFQSRRHMLELLDVWNGQQPGTWAYWTRPEPVAA